jgi:hypothetical protein
MDYKLTLTQQELQQVVNALSELPFKQVAAVFSNIQKQVQDQEDLSKEE